MDFSLIDFQPIWLSLQLAGVTVLILLVLATPVAWWLAHTRCRFRVVVEAVVVVQKIMMVRMVVPVEEVVVLAYQPAKPEAPVTLLLQALHKGMMVVMVSPVVAKVVVVVVPVEQVIMGM